MKQMFGSKQSRFSNPLVSPLRAIAGILLWVGGASGSLLPAAAPVLPEMIEGFTVQLVGQEPLVRNPCAMTFDARGRLFVGQGPQYRNPKPETPGDTIVILIDRDGDGVYDETKTFAEGLNCVQGLAWHGNDLWVANSPDLTVVRDLDGDDVADEYVRVYSDLGNIEHAIHGLNWAPDGKLYMSKGNSKGLTIPGRIAPKPFRELWGVTAPAGSPDFPEPQTFTKESYKHTYQDPVDDWGREGGVLRCDDMGANLEIVARGVRNPFDISFDSSFDWLGTDNDQSEGDRIFMPFYGAHFGWSHPWSSNWTGAGHLPTAPISGPVFTGSGTGVIYADIPGWPAAFRGVWFINDYLHRTTYAYRPAWAGALLEPAGGHWEPFARGNQPLYSPVDIEIGPAGFLYITGWGTRLGATYVDGKQTNEGRVFRIAPKGFTGIDWHAPKRDRPIKDWTEAELIDDLGTHLPIWRINAADELVRRGSSAMVALKERLAQKDLPTGQETWALWTLGRCQPEDGTIDQWLEDVGGRLSANARLQSVRIAGFRARSRGDKHEAPTVVLAALGDKNPRVRLVAVEAIAQLGGTGEDTANALWELLAKEQDRVTFYAAWQAQRRWSATEALRQHLSDPRAGVRRGALLALLETGKLEETEVRAMLKDRDLETAGIAGLWLAKRGGNALIRFEPSTTEFTDSLVVAVSAGIKPGKVSHSIDGSAPDPRKATAATSLISLTDTTTIKAAFVVDGQQVGNVTEVTYYKRPPVMAGQDVALAMPAQPTTVEQVMPIISQGNAVRGRALVDVAGCASCHRIQGAGGAFGPDLTDLLQRGNPEQIVRSILDPNADITEGYAMLSIKTKDGQDIIGRRQEESGTSITMMRPDGSTTTVARAAIASSESQHTSPMPQYAQMLSAAQVADIIAWIAGGEKAAAEISAAADVAAAGFHTDLLADRVIIRDGSNPVAEFVFDHPEILRPSLQNLHTPTGVLLTRSQPVAPPEAIDHQFLHPGISLAFSDINGEDFWRNKARIVHQRFVLPPEDSANRVRFQTLSVLRSVAGVKMGGLETDVMIERVEDGYLISWDAIIQAADQPLVFGDNEEMGFATRVTHALTEKNGGQVTSGNGETGAKNAWGKIAPWCVYAAPLQGRNVGVAVFAADGNPRQSWWHVRDYGLISANSFGKKATPSTADGTVVVAPGKRLILQYAVLAFDLPAGKAPDFAAISQAYNAEASVRR